MHVVGQLPWLCTGSDRRGGSATAWKGSLAREAFHKGKPRGCPWGLPGCGQENETSRDRGPAAGGAALDQPRGTWVQGSCGSFNFVFRFNLVNVGVLLVSEGRSGTRRLHVTPGAHDIPCPPQRPSPMTPSPSAKARGSLTTIPPAPVASRRWPSSREYRVGGPT